MTQDIDVFFTRAENYYEKANNNFFNDCLKSKQQMVCRPIGECEKQLDDFKRSPQFTTYFDALLVKQSTAKKKSAHALSNLIGSLTKGLSQLVAKKAGDAIPIAPLGQATELGLGLLGNLMGNVLSNSLYKRWKNDSKQNPTLEEFENQLSLSGFNKKRWNTLSKQLIESFHFRECLLLGLSDANNTNFRKAFLHDYYNSSTIKKKTLNAAIENYFLMDLNQLFSDVFSQVYQHNEQAIEEQDDADEKGFRQWIHSLFTSAQQKSQFSQQVTLDFMKATSRFLDQKQFEPSKLARFSHLSAIGIGIGTALLISLSTFLIMGSLPVLIMIPIIVVSLLVSTASFFAIKKFTPLKFKRGRDNREAIQEAIEATQTKSTQLSQTIDYQVDTNPYHIKQLKKLNEERRVSKALFISHYVLGRKDLSIALGSATSWLRAYLCRYRHSPLIESGLKKEDKEIIQNAQKQTSLLQAALNSHDKKGLKRIKHFIVETQDYLSDEKNAEFIDTFELKEKIREQILEIVSEVPENKDLPQQLINFYHKDLGGQIQELELARQLCANSSQALYERLAHEIDRKRNQQKNKPMFTGHKDARKLLSLQDINIDAHFISKENVLILLNNSFDFLHSLNKGSDNMQRLISLDTPLLYSPEFILYRSMLLAELSELVNPNHSKVDSYVAETIKAFIEEKFHVEPDMLLNDLSSQTLLSKLDDSLSPLDSASNAIRLNLAYASTPLTARQLIEMELLTHSSIENTSSVFGLNQNNTHFTPQTNELFAKRVNDAIDNTLTLLNTMQQRAVLDEKAIITPFIQEAITDIFHLNDAIREELILIKNQQPLSDEVEKFYAPIAKQLNKLCQTLNEQLPEPSISSPSKKQEKDNVKSKKNPSSNGKSHFFHFKSPISKSTKKRIDSLIPH